MLDKVITLSAGAGATLGLFLLTNCSTDTSGTGPIPDASMGDDVTADSPPDTADGGVDHTVDSPADAAELGTDSAAACNAQNCGGACCGDQCVADCDGCNAGAVFCPYAESIGSQNGVCVASCTSCNINGATAAATCVLCSFGFTTVSCASSAGRCPPDFAAGACGCTPADAGACLTATQVCIPDDASAAGGACLTCGELGTDLATCGNGAMCRADAGVCAP
jgi:hypothetical protein